MIEVRNLVKKYGDHLAVDHLDFKIETGRIYGFLGPNGAGKSTTMNIMTGYLGATEGEVIINGHDILKEPEEAKQHIGYLPEQPPLYMDMTVREYLEFAAELKGLKKRQSSGEIAEVEKLVKIKDVEHRLIKNLSKGYRQRVGLAQAVLGFPEIIILDEPSVGLDPKQIIEIRELIRKLAKNHTVILSSHILAEVREVCDHIMIISKGRLVASDTPENLERLFALLESQAIRSCPLKGIDLMFEVYPDPALRPTGDWDLLIHPDDCARAGEVLRAAGWVQPYATGHDHHFPAFRKDGVTLEVHFRLPNFGELPMTEVWAETVPAGYGGFRRRLTPELNLLMLFRHAAGNHWRQVLPHKLLPDAGWLLKRQGVDWARLRQLCARWRFPSPEVLVKAWPEFFPEELRAHCRATPEQCRDLRWIQDHQPKLIELTATEFAWAQPDRLSGHWLRARLAALAPENLRHKYQLKRIRFRDYPGLYWRELLGKFRGWCRTVGGGPERELVREHFRRCRRLEESGSR